MRITMLEVEANFKIYLLYLIKISIIDKTKKGFILKLNYQKSLMFNFFFVGVITLLLYYGIENYLHIFNLNLFEKILAVAILLIFLSYLFSISFSKLKKFKLISEICFEAIFIVKNNRVININEKVTEIFGYSLKDIKNIDFDKLIVDEFRDSYKLNDSKEAIIKMKKKDGKSINIEIKSKLLNNRDNYKIIIARDFEKESKLINKIKFNENYFRTILDTQQDIVIITDGKHLLDANRAFFEFFNQYSSVNEFTKEHSCICDFFEIVDRENYITQSYIDGLNWIDYILKNANKKYKVLMKKNGQDFIFSLNAKHMSFDDRNRNVVVFNNITDIENYHTILEEKVQEELDKRLKTERIYKKITSSTFDGILSIDDEGKVLTWNKSCEDIFGYKSREVIGENFHKLILQKEFLQGFENFKTTGKSNLIGGVSEFEAIHKDGHKFFVEISFSAVKIDGRWHAIGVIRDLTEKKVLEKEKKEQEQILIQQSKMASMGEMIGAIAHQWRQPLNALSLLIQKLQLMYHRDKLTNEAMDSSVAKSKRLINQMSETIDDFRNFFKPNKQKEHFSVIEAINDVVHILSAQFTQHNIELLIDTKDETFIFGYPNEFKQVILNILNNAKDAILDMGQTNAKFNGKIEIKVFKEENIFITILDNGGGIKQDILDKIFEPYFTTKDDNKGTGIGLYMSKTIIENMDGNLSVENLEDGAIFTIILPLN